MKIIWMSDPHFQNEGTIAGLNPRVRLDAALEHANAHYSDAAFIVMSGDLVGDDIAGDYTALAARFAASGLRIYPMVGNNDGRAAFLEMLALPEPAMPGFAQYQIETPEGVVICLDTHKPGSSAGELCEARLAWLQDALNDSGERPAYVFMHHPPFALGLPKQDEIMLEAPERFLDVLAKAGNVPHLFMGHVHRTTCGTFKGIPFASLGSLAFQAPPPRPSWDWKDFRAAEEAPHYAVIDLENGNVTVQFIQFCDYSLGVET